MRPRPSDRMQRLFASCRDLLHAAIVHSASLLVPASQRAEWRREWRGELWHVRQACAPVDGTTWRRKSEVTAFCLGAFNDALCLARADRRPGLPLLCLPFAEIKGTPKQCMAMLGAALCASYGLALLLPGVQAERSLWPRTENSSLVMIEQDRSHADARPSIKLEQYEMWRSRQQTYFDRFAFYRVQPKLFVLEADAPRTRIGKPWNVGLAGSDFLAIVGLPPRFTQSEARKPGALPEILLSERVWKRAFGADAHVAGKLVRLGGQVTRIAGVVPDGALGLPGKVDAWQLSPDFEAAAGAPGYLVAHLTPAGQAEMWADRIFIAVLGPEGSEVDLLGVSLGEWQPSPATVFLFGLMLALLCLPAITSVSLSERSVNPRKTSWAGKLLSSGFLAVKVLFLLPIAYFVSLELAYGCTSLSRESAVYLQLASTFALCLFGLCWMLRDQRQRCPVCLSRVVHPAQVGQASRTFLDWNGTEMMCLGGHTLLHVPSQPTSWFSTQRWLYLDTSWDFLFVAPTRPIH